jgi:hypothetical protein
MHIGFDRLAYPGDAVMQSLWDSTPCAFVAVYLAPAPSQANTSWMPKIPALRSMGWGMAPVYVGQQAPGGPGSHVLTAAQGTTDAADAAGLASSGGLDTASVIYLDVEVGGQLPTAFMNYISAWVTGIQASDYLPGIYCSFSQTASQITAAVGDIPAWVFHPSDQGPNTIDLSAETPPDPGKSGFAPAFVWQYRMSLKGAITITWKDSLGAQQSLKTVDLDSAICKDPSKPVLPTPAVTSVSPTSATAGDTITIIGTEFDGVTDVGFGAVSAANVNVDSDTQIEAVVPNGLAGETIDVIVTNRWSKQSAAGNQVTVN